MRHARAVMHVGIANWRWRGKRSRHSRRIRNRQFYISGKRPMKSSGTWHLTPHTSHWHRFSTLWGFINNVVSFIEARRFIINILGYGRLFHSNTQTLMVSDNRSRDLRPLTMSIWGQQFSSSGGTRWHNIMNSGWRAGYQHSLAEMNVIILSSWLRAVRRGFCHNILKFIFFQHLSPLGDRTDLTSQTYYYISDCFGRSSYA